MFAPDQIKKNVCLPVFCFAILFLKSNPSPTQSELKFFVRVGPSLLVETFPLCFSDDGLARALNVTPIDKPIRFAFAHGKRFGRSIALHL